MVKKHGLSLKVKNTFSMKKTCNNLRSIFNLDLVFSPVVSFNRLCYELWVSIYRALALGSLSASSGLQGRAFQNIKQLEEQIKANKS